MKWRMTNQLKEIGGCLLVGLFLSGCGSVPDDGAQKPGPYVFPGQVSVQPVPGPIPVPEPTSVAVRLRVGDLLTVTFSDLPPPHNLPDHKERIREDGKITLHYNVAVDAAGKTPGELQEDIRKAYVPRYYVNLTVTVKTEERVFYVGGEVKVPNRQYYIADMTVLRAVQTAGDFTDFANRKNIELIRSNGQKYKINWYKAIKDPKLDLPVFPNDYIIIHKKRF